MSKPSRRVWAFLDERLGLGIFRYEVPHHANTVPYALGGAAAVGFVVLILTGILLAQGYHPSPEQANDSVRDMAESAPMAFLRNVHYWAAQLTLALVALHMLRVFLTAAYKRPRELQWVVGVLLLFLSVAFCFTGSVLKWDQEASEAVAHNAEMADLLSSVGFWFAAPYLASAHVLVRFYTLHVSIFPMALGALMLFHFYLVKHLKISSLPRESELPTSERSEPFSRHGRIVGTLAGAFLALTILLALVLPAPLGPAPIEGIELTKPLWPFLWLYAIENAAGIQWLFPATMLLLTLLLVVPLVDRNPARSPKDRRLALGLAILGTLVLLALSLWAALAPAAQHLG